MFRNTILAASAVLLSAVATHAGDEPRPFELMVGDSAPALSVEWIKGEPVQGFRDDTTYVVEFWATWCGPCIKAMPHLSELQAKYADRKVRFVGVSVWEQEQEKVRPFVEEMGDKMAYTVAMDLVPEVPEDQRAQGKMAMTWMDASGREGIPSSFIVQKGKIQWMGHPGSMDGPLEEIVAGRWDLERAAKEHYEASAAQGATQRLGRALQAQMQAGKWEEALAELNTAFGKFPKLEQTFAPQKLFCMIRAGDKAGSMAYAEALTDGLFKANAQGLNIVAWMIVNRENAHLGLDAALARRAAKTANELTGWKEPAVLDTYATALFLTGELQQAVEMQEKAVKLAVGTPMEADLKKRLEEFRSKLDARG